MARGFRWYREQLRADLPAEEAKLVRSVFLDVHRMLNGPSTDAPATDTPKWARDLGLADLDNLDLTGDPSEALPGEPEDPALARLLPTARSDDPLAAAEFRRLTEGGVRARKQTALASAISVLRRWERARGPQLMSQDEAVDLLTGLTDVRLVLASRLGIETDEDATLVHERAARPAAPDEDPQQRRLAWLAAVYDFLTWLQEDLAHLLVEQLPEEGTGGRPPPVRAPEDH